MAGLFAWLFGHGKTDANAAEPETENAMISLDDPRYVAYASLRHSYWEKIGKVDHDVIAYMISPEFQGAPAWPTTRQAFLVVRTSNSLIIASDGLTDLFVNTNMQDAGFGSEVYIEVGGMEAATFEQIKQSWAFSLIENFARNVADRGGIADTVERYGVVSMELPAPDEMNTSWVSDSGQVGVLIGLSAEGRTSKLSLDDQNEIRMIPITIISPAELAFVANGGAEARKELARKLGAASINTQSDLGRKSTI